MSAPSQLDPRVDQAAATDESLLAAHEKLLGKQPDEKGHYRLLPLNILFFASALIMFGGTYLGRYAGHFDSRVYNENVRHGPSGTETAAPVDPVVLGKKLYNNAACNTCHQPTGLGLPGAFPPLANSEWVTGAEERVIRIVLYGLQGPIKVGTTDYNSAMPAFGRVAGSGFNWTDEKVAAVLTYIRQEWGNNAGPITVEKVAAVRTKEGDHKPWLAAELEKLP
ncbi:MAG: cytochrome c [Opitutus sp.]|nr:cytochrome c [Opitutus sp.]